MVSTLIVVYLIGGLAVTFAAYVASSRLVDPPDDRLLVSAVAGALWPLLVVGLAWSWFAPKSCRRTPKPSASSASGTKIAS